MHSGPWLIPTTVARCCSLRAREPPSSVFAASPATRMLRPFPADTEWLVLQVLAHTKVAPLRSPCARGMPWSLQVEATRRWWVVRPSPGQGRERGAGSRAIDELGTQTLGLRLETLGLRLRVTVPDRLVDLGKRENQKLRHTDIGTKNQPTSPRRRLAEPSLTPNRVLHSMPVCPMHDVLGRPGPAAPARRP